MHCLFLIFSAVQTSKTSFQIAEEYTIKRPHLKKNLNSVIMHQLASLISKVSAQSQLPKHPFK